MQFVHFYECTKRSFASIHRPLAKSLLAEYVTNSNEICTRTSERARVARNQQQNKSMKYIAVRYEY